MDSQALTDLKANAQRRYDQDGAIETLMGFGLMISGVGMATHSSAGAFTPVLIVLLAMAWQRRITYPRLGYAAFVDKRRDEFRRRFLPIVLAVLLLLILVIIAFGSARKDATGGHVGMAPNGKIAIGLILSALIASIAALRRLPHLYIVAGLLTALFVGAAAWQVSPGYALAVTGMVSFVIGLVRLVRFLRANPRLDGV
jgi:hypothetical protein